MLNPEQSRLWNFDTPITHFDVLKAFEKDGTWYSRLQIAQNLRRAKSPSLLLKIDDLTYQGFLRSDKVALPNGVHMFVYQLTERGCDAILHGALPPAFNAR